ncbi:hypothetical protein OROHE_011488 [Orobanche hederae]
MTSRTLRRRLHHRDVDGGTYDRYESSRAESLREPLLGNSDHDNKHSEGQKLEDILDDERSIVRLHWALLFSNVIAQWAQWLANIVLGSGSLLGRILPFVSGYQNGANSLLRPVLLSPLQLVGGTEERLGELTWSYLSAEASSILVLSPQVDGGCGEDVNRRIKAGWLK